MKVRAHVCRQSTQENVAVVRVMSEMKVRAEGELVVRHTVNSKRGLHTITSDLNFMPASVVNVGTDVQGDFAVSPVYDVEDCTDPSIYMHDLKEVIAATVISIHQQTLSLGRLEFETERSIDAGVPVRESCVRIIGALYVEAVCSSAQNSEEEQQAGEEVGSSPF